MKFEEKKIQTDKSNRKIGQNSSKGKTAVTKIQYLINAFNLIRYNQYFDLIVGTTKIVTQQQLTKFDVKTLVLKLYSWGLFQCEFQEQKLKPFEYLWVDHIQVTSFLEQLTNEFCFELCYLYRMDNLIQLNLVSIGISRQEQQQYQMITFFVTYILLVGQGEAKSTIKVDNAISLLGQSKTQSDIYQSLNQISNQIDQTFPVAQSILCTQCSSRHSSCYDDTRCSCDQGYIGQLCDWKLVAVRPNITKDFDMFLSFIQSQKNLNQTNLELFITVNIKLVNISGLSGYNMAENIYDICTSILQFQSSLNYQHTLLLNKLSYLGYYAIYQEGYYDIQQLYNDYKFTLGLKLKDTLTTQFMAQRTQWKMEVSTLYSNQILIQRIKSSRTTNKNIVFDQDKRFTFKISKIRSLLTNLGEFYIEILIPYSQQQSDDYDLNAQFTVSFYDTDGTKILSTKDNNPELFVYRIQDCSDDSSTCLEYIDNTWQVIYGVSNRRQSSYCICGAQSAGSYGVGYVPNDKKKYDNKELGRNYILAMLLPYFGIQILLIILYFLIKFPDSTATSYVSVKQAEVSQDIQTAKMDQQNSYGQQQIQNSYGQQYQQQQPPFVQQPQIAYSPQPQQAYAPGYPQQAPPMYGQPQLYPQQQPLYTQQPMFQQQQIVYLQAQIPQAFVEKSWAKRKCDSIWNPFPYQGVCKPSPVRFGAFCLNFANYSFLFGITLYSNGKPAYLKSEEGTALTYAIIYLMLIIFVSPWLGYLWSTGGYFIKAIVKHQPYVYIAVLIFQTALYLVLVLYTGVGIIQNQSPKLEMLLNFCIGAGFYILMLGVEFLGTLFSYPCECLRKIRGFKFMDFADETS